MACIKLKEFYTTPAQYANNKDYGPSFSLIIDECKRKLNNLFFWNTFDIYSYKNPHVMAIINMLLGNQIPSDISMIVIEYMGTKDLPVPHMQIECELSKDQIDEILLHNRWLNFPDLAIEFEKIINNIYVNILDDKIISENLKKYNRVSPSVHVNETYDLLLIVIINVIKNTKLITDKTECLVDKTKILHTFCKKHIEKYHDSLYYQHMWDIQNEKKLRFYKISEFRRITPNKYTSVFEDEHNILRMIYHLFMHHKYFVYESGRVVSIDPKIFNYRGKRDSIMDKLLNLANVDHMFRWLTWYQKLIYVKITAMREKRTYKLLDDNDKIDQLTKDIFDNVCDNYWYNFHIYDDIYGILENIDTLFCYMGSKSFDLDHFQISEHCYDFNKTYESHEFYQLPGEEYKPMEIKINYKIKKSEILQDMQTIFNKLGLFTIDYVYIESFLCGYLGKLEHRTGRVNYSQDLRDRSYFKLKPSSFFN